MSTKTPRQITGPSNLLGEMLALGMMRISDDGLAILRPDNSVFAEKCAPPTINPDGGAFGSLDVTLACATDGASIYSTQDGTDPNTGSDLYTVPFAIAASCELRVLAIRPGLLDSAVVSAAFVINGQVATPTFDPPAGALVAGSLVTIACATPGAAIYYTTDGSAPSAAKTHYVAPVAINVGKTLKAIAIHADYDDSEIGSAAYTIVQVATPTFDPPAGAVAADTPVAIACATAGASIYYTVNGDAPTALSTLYEAPVVVGGAETIKAIAIKALWLNSEVGSAAYTIAP